MLDVSVHKIVGTSEFLNIRYTKLNYFLCLIQNCKFEHILLVHWCLKMFVTNLYHFPRILIIIILVNGIMATSRHKKNKF